jgi:hypothetical protein
LFFWNFCEKGVLFVPELTQRIDVEEKQQQEVPEVQKPDVPATKEVRKGPHQPDGKNKSGKRRPFEGSTGDSY